MTLGAGIAIAGVSAAVAVIGCFSPDALIFAAPFAALVAIEIWS